MDKNTYVGPFLNDDTKKTLKVIGVSILFYILVYVMYEIFGIYALVTFGAIGLLLTLITSGMFLLIPFAPIYGTYTILKRLYSFLIRGN